MGMVAIELIIKVKVYNMLVRKVSINSREKRD